MKQHNKMKLKHEYMLWPNVHFLTLFFFYFPSAAPTYPNDNDQVLVPDGPEPKKQDSSTGELHH